ncbi:MAG: TonB-dependent receptor [Gemmatimonadota bacterium]
MTRSSIASAAFVVLAAIAAPGPAAGQAPTDTASADTFAIPGVVVTATRLPLPREALPIPVTVLTRGELEASGARTVADALRRVPGAALARSGPTGAQTSLFLRGGESDYVQVLIDGVPVNDPGGAFDFAGLSLDQVERIEVVRGPVSVLYGSDAVSGVVHLFTRRGAGAPTVTAELTGGRGEQRHGADDGYGLWDASLGAAGSRGAFDWAVGGGASRSGGLYPMNNVSSRQTGSLRLGWTPAPGAELSVSSRITDGRYHVPTDGGGAVVDENAYLDRRLWTTTARGGLRLHDRLDARVQVGWVTRDQASIDRRDGPADTTGTYASTLDFGGTRALADARLDARLPGATVSAGVAWERADASTDYTSRSDFGPLDASAEYSRATTGYYAQVLASPLDRLHLTLGARIDDSETFGTFETYRVGATLRVAPGTRVRGAIGRAFREPTFAESFGSGFGDAGNPGLEPERTRSWEAGLEQGVGPATLAATWFDQRFDSLIQYTFSPPAEGDPNYFNVGAATARGLEIELRAAAGPWSADAAYSRVETEVVDPGLATDASFEQGQPLLRRPTHTGSVTGRYTAGSGTLSVSVHAVGEREDMDFGAGFPAPRVDLPAYATVDAAAAWALPIDGPSTELLVRVENLLDEEYRTIAGFPSAGRLVRVGARVRIR